MLETPQIVNTSAQPTAILHLTVPRNEIREVMGPGLAAVRAAVAAQGIAATGPWFTHHLKLGADLFDFEICLPVTAPIAAADRVKPSQWPAMKFARTIYHGDYQNLGAAWAEFNAWIAAGGHTPGPDLWERYAVGPDLSPDPAAWRTELNRPLTS